MADKNLIGHKLGTFSTEVEKGRLRFFAKAIGETDPVYTDEAVAKAAGHKSLPLAPTFLKCLEGEGRELTAFLKLVDFDLGRILHAEQSFVYHKMAYAGDVLTFDATITDVYEKKGGALQFVVTESRVTNQDGEHIADVRSSLVQR
ncbi:MaoC family dehydratase N-terminal domain-containing protein [Pseudomonas sp. JQ170]|uniref:MaoC family dehydratase N-terminal domain-containing protein n=1 Tax=unclassified Pseudomonas TaxID=196821 RepID=UPI00264D6E76|nr:MULTISPECIES: MaoC family dehydratase N-terminal domain-containing protein [unclassified Pseudomonas]MDN7140058.1 MaoC family dehydratase N-terminal domain-containing protein [Pseudomonas sp. JQ170]WRO78585.1 MaoC family dehydratase N-terminal domain-containing protein [Pseudomonas sp. 170C]